MAGSYRDIQVSAPIEGVSLIRIARPEVRNALRTQTLAEIADALRIVEGDARLRACVITGDDKAFAAGADIRELAALDATAARADVRPQHWRAIQACAKPLIAAVRGYALGAGCEMALLADMVVAAENACFGQPEINLGIIPGAGGIQRLTRALGKPLAMKMVLTGERLDAAQALAAGLVCEVTAVDQCLPRALELAHAISLKAPLAVAAAKRLVNLAYEEFLAAGLQAERAAFCSLMDSADTHEGIDAFLQKRPAQFRGA